VILCTLKVDILDTCGNPQFPAMRRLSIANANAFLFVYSIDCERSFETVKRNFEEVREQREDYQMLPIVVAGNKLDLPADHRRVTVEDASEWLYCELPKMRRVYKMIINTLFNK
jgi:small GTP-binding protein